MQSLAEECTPLKQRYDSCFNLWFEGYLQPALDGAARRSPMPSAGEGEASPASSSSSASLASSPSSSSSPEGKAGFLIPRIPLVTSWAQSTAFRTRRQPYAPTKAVVHSESGDDMVAAQHVHYDAEDDDLPPLETAGMTRAQIKAAQYERTCGRAWREYQGCLRKAIAKNQNLTTLLEQAREEHPLHSLDGLEGTAWDPNARAE